MRKYSFSIWTVFSSTLAKVYQLESPPYIYIESRIRSLSVWQKQIEKLIDYRRLCMSAKFLRKCRHFAPYVSDAIFNISTSAPKSVINLNLPDFWLKSLKHTTKKLIFFFIFQIKQKVPIIIGFADNEINLNWQHFIWKFLDNILLCYIHTYVCTYYVYSFLLT